MKLQDIYYIVRKYIKSGHLQIVNNGYKEVKGKITDYVFGSATPLKKDVICSTGDWTPFLPVPERQSGRRMESMSCTIFSFLNCIETIIKAKYGITVNYSDRYLSTCAGTTTSGNSMDKVIDTARKYFGNVSEEIWPSNFDEMTWNIYFSSIPKAILDNGRLWIDEYEIGYENVPMNINLMKQALTYSPLYVAGYAWYQEGGRYRSYGRANHAFMISRIESDGTIWAFDSYDPFDKPLDKNYRFGSIKALYVNRLTPQNIEINKILTSGRKYVMRVEDKGQIYKITNGVLEETPIEELIDSLKLDGNKGADFNSVVKDVVKAMFTNNLLAPINEELFNKMK